MASRRGAVLAQPLEEERAKDDDERELAEAPGDAAAYLLVVGEVRVPRQVEGKVEVLAQDLAQLHEVDARVEVDGHGDKQQKQAQAGGPAVRDRVGAHELPEVEVAGDEEARVHDDVPGVLGDRVLVQVKGQVENVEEEQELHEVDRRVRDKSDDPRARRRQRPLVRPKSRLPGLHHEGERRAQREQEWNDHGQHHVAQHVHGVERGNVHAQLRAHKQRHAQGAGHPPRCTSPRPRQAAPTYAPDPVRIETSEQQAQGSPQDIEAEVSEETGDRGSAVKLVAQQKLHGVEVGIARRRGRRAAHGASHADRERHDQQLDKGDAAEELRARLQLRHGELAVREAEEREHEREH